MSDELKKRSRKWIGWTALGLTWHFVALLAGAKLIFNPSIRCRAIARSAKKIDFWERNGRQSEIRAGLSCV
jgi:hypothetical protein